jgi:ketosteroid isomerase-like protein
MGVAGPADLHAATQDAFNQGDVDALVSLYADGGCLVDADGSVASGLDAIRGVWAGFVSLGGQITMTTRYCIERRDIALLSNAWQFTSVAMDLESASAEVAVRGDDGRWRYLIDNPTGGAT